MKIVGLILGATLLIAPAPLLAEDMNEGDQIERALTSGDSKALATVLAKQSKSDQVKLTKALKLDARIVGGEPALISDFPWQVALVRGANAEPQRSQFCGGTLIAPDTVITAAHCIDNAIVRSDPGLVNIVAGASAYETGGERRTVRTIIVHPQWNRTSYDYDVAILKLASPVTKGRPIKLSSQSPAPGSRAWVSGWGATVEGGYGSPDLMAVSVPVVSKAICNQKESYGGTMTDRMLCAGEREGGKDSCQGDSGGPLVSGTYMQERLVGIVSWGEGCARRLKYGIYTDTAAISDWSASVIGGSTPITDPRSGDELFQLQSRKMQADR